MCAHGRRLELSVSGLVTGTSTGMMKGRIRRRRVCDVQPGAERAVSPMDPAKGLTKLY
jgi:hypothetical protein